MRRDKLRKVTISIADTHFSEFTAREIAAEIRRLYRIDITPSQVASFLREDNRFVTRNEGDHNVWTWRYC